MAAPQHQCRTISPSVIAEPRTAPGRPAQKREHPRPEARRDADAGARRAVRRQDLAACSTTTRCASCRSSMSTLGTVEADVGRGPAARIRLAHVGLRRADGQFRRDRAAAAAIPAAGARQRHHGRNPRSRRPQHVGEALQRAGRGARQLPEERISADHRRGAVEAQAASMPRACWRSCPRTSRSTSSAAC